MSPCTGDVRVLFIVFKVYFYGCLIAAFVLLIIHIICLYSNRQPVFFGVLSVLYKLCHKNYIVCGVIDIL